MSRSRTVTCSLLAAAVGLGATACVDGGDTTVVILKNQPPEGDTCTISSGESDQFIPSGVIEAGSSSGYFFTPVAKNFAAAANEDEERRRIAFVEGARVELTFAHADTLFTDEELDDFRERGLTRFQVPMAGPINPGSTTSFGFEIIPREIVDRLGEFLDNDLETQDIPDRELVTASVVLFGTIGDSSFDSQLFRYPVEVCLGCLVNNIGACSAYPDTFNPPNTGSACNPLQDQPVDCCSVADGLVCPAVGTMSALQ